MTNLDIRSFFSPFIFFRYTLLNLGSIRFYDLTATTYSLMFVAFHFSYCVYFLDKYFSRKLETTFSYFVTFKPSLVMGFEMDLGLRVRVMDLLITKDWLLRRLRGLGIEGEKVVELVMISGSVRLEFMELIASNEQLIIFTFIMIKLI